jgi:hypothetical protein
VSGDISIDIPFRSLSSEPVVVCIDRVFAVLVANKSTSRPSSSTDVVDSTKLERLKAHELSKFGTSDDIKAADDVDSDSFSTRLASKILANIQIIVRHVQFRFEDDSSPSNPCSLGVCIDEFSGIIVLGFGFCSRTLFFFIVFIYRDIQLPPPTKRLVRLISPPPSATRSFTSALEFRDCPFISITMTTIPTLIAAKHLKNTFSKTNMLIVAHHLNPISLLFPKCRMRRLDLPKGPVYESKPSLQQSVH